MVKVYRIFVVFAFETESDMEWFKKSNYMEYVADKKIAMMEISDSYKMTDFMALFENIFPSYLIYELSEVLEEMVFGKNLRRLDAS